VLHSSLTLFGAGGEPIASVALDIPERLPASLLVRWWREHIQGRTCRYAIARVNRQTRALFLAEDLIPKRAVRVPVAPGLRLRGGWLTRSLRLGEWGGGRAFVGPNLFIRQVDVLPAEAWLAPIFLGFGSGEEPRRVPVEDPGGSTLFEIPGEEGRLFCAVRGGAARLYGAGNTPADRLAAALAEAPASVDDFFWAVGAIPVAGRS
jgi:hypothetical protein